MDFKKKDIADVEEYWNNRPCNIRHSDKPIGTKEYFDEVEKRKYFVEPHIPKFAEFGKWKNKNVLEIGCGIGTDSINFERVGAKLTITDLSMKSLEICQKRFNAYELDVEFYCCDAESLSATVPPQIFDLIYSFGVIHHTPNPEKVFNEIKLFMNENSELRFMVYNKASIKILQMLNESGNKFNDIDEMISMYSEAQSGCPITHSYTANSIRDMLDSLGYNVLSVEADHIFKYDIPNYVKYKYVTAEVWKNISHESFRELEKQFGWHLLVKAKLK